MASWYKMTPLGSTRKGRADQAAVAHAAEAREGTLLRPGCHHPRDASHSGHSSGQSQEGEMAPRQRPLQQPSRATPAITGRNALVIVKVGEGKDRRDFETQR